MTKRVIAVFTVGLFLVFFTQACTIKLSGASTQGLKTINVGYFENNAQLVVGNLSQNFTEALKNRIRTTSSLSIIQGEADASMSGSITGYTIEPVSIQATNNNVAPIAGANRLTITVSVTYTNKANKKNNFTQSFPAFADFTGDIANQEQGLIATITKQLTEDIFNKAFANW